MEKIVVNGREFYMNEEAWNRVVEWNNRKNNELHKHIVEYFKELDSKCRALKSEKSKRK